MKERPIIFNTEMVEAILDGRKWQTRRVLKKQPNHVHGVRYDGIDEDDKTVHYFEHINSDGSFSEIYEDHRCHYGKPGDHLWVKEAFCVDDWRYPRGPIEEFKESVCYFAKPNAITKRQPKWYDAKVMPRWASRILLEITDVRCERVQDISVTDIQAEGINFETDNNFACAEYFMSAGSPVVGGTPEHFAFIALWDSIYHGEKRWAANPWVWVIEFRRVE